MICPIILTIVYQSWLRSGFFHLALALSYQKCIAEGKFRSKDSFQ